MYANATDFLRASVLEMHRTLLSEARERELVDDDDDDDDDDDMEDETASLYDDDDDDDDEDVAETETDEDTLSSDDDDDDDDDDDEDVESDDCVEEEEDDEDEDEGVEDEDEPIEVDDGELALEEDDDDVGAQSAAADDDDDDDDDDDSVDELATLFADTGAHRRPWSSAHAHLARADPALCAFLEATAFDALARGKKLVVVDDDDGGGGGVARLVDAPDQTERALRRAMPYTSYVASTPALAAFHALLVEFTTMHERLVTDWYASSALFREASALGYGARYYRQLKRAPGLPPAVDLTVPRLDTDPLVDERPFTNAIVALPAGATHDYMRAVVLFTNFREHARDWFFTSLHAALADAPPCRRSLYEQARLAFAYTPRDKPPYFTACSTMYDETVSLLYTAHDDAAAADEASSSASRE